MLLPCKPLSHPPCSLHDPPSCSIQSGTGRDSGPSGKPLARANTDLYYANGVEDELLEVDRMASPSPRQSALMGAGGSVNGWAEGGAAAAAGRPPRPKSSPRMPAPMLGPPSGRAGETDAAFTDGTPPGLRGKMNEVSESEAAALSGSGQRPVHLYAGPANRSNTAAAEYLRNQVGGTGSGTSTSASTSTGGSKAGASGLLLLARLTHASAASHALATLPSRCQGFTFPTMLAAGASPGQAQLLQAAPRVSLAVLCRSKSNSCSISPAPADASVVCELC